MTGLSHIKHNAAVIVSRMLIVKVMSKEETLEINILLAKLTLLFFKIPSIT